MKPSRYYYDCPIEALYMMHKYGMSFCYGNHVEVEERHLIEFIEIKLADSEPPYYLTEESAAFLEPQEGDILYNENLGARTMYLPKIKPCKCEKCINIEEPKYTTILRNGKHFFWPKMEISDEN